MSSSQKDFYAAVTAVIDGDIDTLRRLLSEFPDLVNAHGTSEHHAMLIHYTAANGVEDELQRTPSNAAAICTALLTAGADPNATCDSYNGGPNQTPLCLLVTSWHPYERGVQNDLVRILVAGGARVDGLQGDGAPLAAALVFGYTSAATTLVALGATVDNLYFAAGIGDLEQVRAYFGDDGKLCDNACGKYAPPLPPTDSEDPNDIVQEALHFAVTHSHRSVAEYLLGRGADVNGQVRGHHCGLPLLQAMFVGEYALALYLLECGADVDRVDEKRKTTGREQIGACDSAPLRAWLDRGQGG